MMDKIGELCQCAALLGLVANNLLLQQRIRKLEQKFLDFRVDSMAEGIRQALEPQLQAWGLKKEDDNGLST